MKSIAREFDDSFQKGAFLKGFTPRIGLVDEINTVDRDGEGRAVATVNLHSKHVVEFQTT
ncbi:MAG: hypothetical protein AAF670_15735 [Planctomycetota bacterium]